MGEVRLEEDFPMQDQEEEETPDEDQTNWWETHLKYSWEYKRKLSTSSLNGSFMSAFNISNPTITKYYQRSMLFLTYIQGAGVSEWVSAMSKWLQMQVTQLGIRMTDC